MKTSPIRLDGRVALITGAGAGIGAQTAKRLAEAGATVCVTDVSIEAARAVADKIRQWNPSSHAVALDVVDRAAAIAAARAVCDRFGRLDIWVNNAAIAPPFASVLDIDPRHVRRIRNVNVDGVFWGACAAAAHMRDGGVIVNVSGTITRRAVPNFALYKASKHAVEGLTAALAKEFGALGVRVLGVAPGFTATKPAEHYAAAHAAMGNLPLPPLGRHGVSDDIARVVLFCVSDLAGFMSGVTLAVDGGGAL